MAQQSEKPKQDTSEAGGKQAAGRKAEDAARAQAQEIRGAAERDAREIREAAEREALKIKKAAEAEARKTRKATEAEARRTELANQAREAEAREAEEAAREEAGRIIAAAAAERDADELPALFAIAQDQLEATTKLTQALWQRSFDMWVGTMPAYLDLYEQSVSALKPFAPPTGVLDETTEAGAAMTRRLLNA